MAKVLQVPRRHRAERIARDLNYVVIESLRSVLKHGGVDAFDKAPRHYRRDRDRCSRARLSTRPRGARHDPGD
jgi:hypothetical protein